MGTYYVAPTGEGYRRKDGAFVQRCTLVERHSVYRRAPFGRLSKMGTNNPKRINDLANKVIARARLREEARTKVSDD